MSLSALFEQKKVFSFEVFPPKKTEGLALLEPTFAGLAKLSPDYISVTLGAAGNAALRQTTLDAVDLIQNTYNTPSVAHLPAINFKRAEIDEFLTVLSQRRIKRVLALRGDKSPDRLPETDFPYAVDLVSYIKKKGGFSIGAACYPETHLEATSEQADLMYLKQKVDAGVDYLITQLFFDNQLYFNFLEKTAKLGINVPIQAGVMPITHVKQIKHIADLTQVHFPPALTATLNRYQDDPASLKAAGLDYAVNQIVALLEQGGSSGIHLYTMNNATVAETISQRITEAIGKAV